MDRIAIVGAGIAGLNAALTLRDAGLACDIYEASDRVGGRMHSHTTTWADGMVSEWCGEFIDSDHEVIHQLIKRFQLAKVNLERKRIDGATNVVYLLNRYYESAVQNDDFSKIAPLLRQQMQDIGPETTYNNFTEAAYQLDQMNAYDWIKRYVEGGHQSALGHLMNASCTGFYGLDTREQSALNLVYMFGLRAQIPDGSSFQPMHGSIRIVGGNQQLPLAIAQSLPEGSLHLRHRLTALVRNADDSLTLTFTTPGGTLEVQADRVILALPFSTLRHVDCQRAGFDSLKQTVIQELGYGTISKLILEFDMPYWFANGPWAHPNNGFIVTDLDIMALWDTSLGQHTTHGLLVDFVGGSKGAAFSPPSPYSTSQDFAGIQEYARRSLSQLEHVLPGISAHYTGRAVLSYPTGDPNLLGSYACWRVGQYTRFAGYEQVRQGPIHFAGEHCSVEFQGFMEGAAREGARAAQEIIGG